HDVHHEDLHHWLDQHCRREHGEHDERDERDTGHAVGLEPVGAGAYGIAGVVPGTVGDHAWVPGVVFLHIEDNLHQVGADVRDFGENSAGDTQRRGAKRLTDGEPDEARTCVITRYEQQNEKHDHQLDADQEHADAHSGL